jgi:hypothetical protein
MCIELLSYYVAEKNEVEENGQNQKVKGWAGAPSPDACLYEYFLM